MLGITFELVAKCTQRHALGISCFPAERKRRASMSKRLLVVLLLFFSIAACVAPSHPVPIETWTISADGRTASVTGRVKQPIWKKLNPVWWLLNDDEPDPPDWQLPGKPYFIRQLSWYARNPFQNFGKYVFGVYDRNYSVTGTAPVYATNWSEIDPSKTGWKVATIRVGAFKLNIKNSPIQFW
jgi:hypothetical protein